MNNPAHTIKQATLGIIILVLVSKVIGFGREMIIAYRFGTSLEYDVYLVAASIPLAIYTLVAGLSNYFIPQMSRATTKRTGIAPISTIWPEFFYSLIGCIAISLSVFTFASVLVEIIAPGFNEETIAKAVYLTRIMTIIIVFSYLETFFRSALNNEKKFIIPASGPLIANIILIGSIILFAAAYSTRAIVYGVIVGYLVQIIVLYFPFRSLKFLQGIKKFSLSFTGNGKFLTAILFILIIEGSAQVNAVVDRFFASSMETGIISALGYSYVLYNVPISIFAFALATAIFPYFSESLELKQYDTARYIFHRAVTLSMLIAVPIMIVFWIFLEDIIVIAFHRGAFDSRSIDQTAYVMRYFIPGMAGQFLFWIITRVYYAGREYKVLMINVALVVFLKLFFAYYLIENMGAAGLALSTSISYSAGALFLMALSKRVLPGIGWKKILTYFFKLIAISVVVFWVASVISNWDILSFGGMAERIANTVIKLSITAVTFFLCGLIFNIPELRAIFARITGKG
ncbi:MAG: murein biosynthesis integral membrane protein MurJ [candidate division Zixibacteria bacterium]